MNKLIYWPTMTTKSQQFFNVSLEGLFGLGGDSIVELIRETGGFVRPFSDETIQSLQKKLDFKLDEETIRMFKRFGHFQYTFEGELTYESFTPAEILACLQSPKWKKHKDYPRKALPVGKQHYLKEGTAKETLYLRDVSHQWWAYMHDVDWQGKQYLTFHSCGRMSWEYMLKNLVVPKLKKQRRS